MTMIDYADSSEVNVRNRSFGQSSGRFPPRTPHADEITLGVKAFALGHKVVPAVPISRPATPPIHSGIELTAGFNETATLQKHKPG